jgi:hypothetical protein
MILPGTLPLSVIRGIAFETVILLCKDENVLVTGSLSPDVTGTYLLTGQYNGFDFFILPGTPATFLYYHTLAGTYVISRTVTTAALTDFWELSPPGTIPTGSYPAQGAYTGTATATDNPVDLTGFDPKAEVRRTSGSDVILDLNPSTTDALNGEITIPGISSDDTQDFDFVGAFNWDLILVDGAGERSGPYIKGPFYVADNITQIPPT